MKKMIVGIFVYSVLLLCLLYFVFWAVSKDEVIASLGKYEQKEYFTSGGFQDFTDYAKYSFTTANIEENKYLTKIEDTDFTAINIYLDDFERWIETIQNSDPTNEVVVNYDFDRGIIDAGDYFYIDCEEHTWSDGSTSFVNYNIYLFDIQTQILYYFHNNI